MAWNKSQQIEPITDKTKLRNRALYWLGKKDYSIRDFETKLNKVCEIEELKAELLADFIAKQWLDDNRYMQGFVRQKLSAGLGRFRIANELKQHGIKSADIELLFEQQEIDWFELAKTAYQKKYADKPVTDYKERAKRYRYMQYRGFSPDQISYAMDDDSSF